MIRRSRALLQAIATECRQRGTKLCILVVGPVAPYYSAKDGKSPLGQIIANWQIDVPVIDIAIVAQATPMPWLLLFYAQWAFAEQARTRVRRRWSYPSASNRIVPVQHSEQIGEGIRVKDSVTMVIEADKAAPKGSRDSVVNILEFRLGRVPRRVLLDRVFPGSELVLRDDDQTRLLEPAGDHRPVPTVTVAVHRVLALDRVAIEPADHPGSPGARYSARRTALTLLRGRRIALISPLTYLGRLRLCYSRSS